MRRRRGCRQRHARQRGSRRTQHPWDRPIATAADSKPRASAAGSSAAAFRRQAAAAQVAMEGLSRRGTGS